MIKQELKKNSQRAMMVENLVNAAIIGALASVPSVRESISPEYYAAAWIALNVVKSILVAHKQANLNV